MYLGMFLLAVAGGISIMALGIRLCLFLFDEFPSRIHELERKIEYLEKRKR